MRDDVLLEDEDGLVCGSAAGDSGAHPAEIAIPMISGDIYVRSSIDDPEE